MKLKLKDLDKIEDKHFNKMYFNTYEEIKEYLKGNYTKNQEEIRTIIKPFSLHDILAYLNFEIIEIKN